MKLVVDANKICSDIAYLFSEVVAIYPITPSSPMASNIDYLNHTDKLNLFNQKVKLVQMQSEAGVAGAMHGALITGSLATTFTSSQGLLLMIPNMYKIAGEALPGVIHVASRTIATHALSIFGDHSDIYAIRDTGFCVLASNNASEVRTNAVVAHLAAITGTLPFVHFFDGFRTSHELDTLEDISDTEFLKLVDYEKINEFKNKTLHVNAQIQKGLAENEDIYFQSVEARNSLYNAIPDIVNQYMMKVNQITKTDCQPFNYYGARDAEYIIIAMGSVIDTIKLVVEQENKKGSKFGVIAVHLYRPFSRQYLLKVLPKTVRRIAVLDRAKEAGGMGEPLYLDVVAALKEKDIAIVGGRYGLSSKNTTPADIYSVYKMLETNLQNNFTIGIDDDVTNLSLTKYAYEVPIEAQEILIYGFGSDGMVSASKDLLKIVAQKLAKDVDGYFEYDSKKSGGVTVSHLRIKNHNFHAPYTITKADIVVVTKDEYFTKYDIVSKVKPQGILLVNTPDEKVLDQKISAADKKYLLENKITVLGIPADKIAFEYHLQGKINKIMEVVLLRLLKIKKAVTYVEENIDYQFKNKGKEIVLNNKKAIQDAYLQIFPVHLSPSGYTKKIPTTVLEKIEYRQGNDLKVSELLDLKEGSFPVSFSRNEKRNIAHRVVKWLPDKCIECGRCSFVCPHAVIRAFKTDQEALGVKMPGDKSYYLVSISEADCTGCGLCIDICPGLKGHKALTWGEYDEEKQKLSNEYFAKDNDYSETKTIKDLSLVKPHFEFSGACAGCGEAAYLKILTQIVGPKLIIANATGCSSIYGGSVPNTPYSIPWANSLFEDNAEFALGMYLSITQKREQIATILTKSMASVTTEVQEKFKLWLDNQNDYAITKQLQEEFLTLEIPKDLKDLIAYVPAVSIWAVGGDGWAYDIGFGGIDHVLASGYPIKILVLDSEVYSNTGGQSSKASHMGQVAEFASDGKKTFKKDLFRMAMSYPNCYVASISLGANLDHTRQVLLEAQEHDGPALVIAYSTCVEHGIQGGLACSLKEQDLAVKSGYTLLMRYNSCTDKLYLDSKEPNFDLYYDFLDHEIRYHSLKIKNPELAEELFLKSKENAQKRYQFYKEKSTK